MLKNQTAYVPCILCGAYALVLIRQNSDHLRYCNSINFNNKYNEQEIIIPYWQVKKTESGRVLVTTLRSYN